jgi:hypothetical protein
MMRRIIQWLRVAAPPRWIVLPLLPVLGFELVYAFAAWKGWGLWNDLLLRRDVLLLLTATALGVRRAYDFHPLYHHGYRSWLRVTPWTSRVSLPVGPVHLVPQDALWLAVTLFLWHDPQLSRLYLPLCFGVPYLAVVCSSCLATGVTTIGCVLAFGLGEVVRHWYNPLQALSVAFWLYLAAWLGIRRSLAQFPWTLSWFWDMSSLQAVAEEQKRRMLGWPLDQLHGRPGEEPFNPFHATVIGLLVGWWSYCLTSLITLPGAATPFRWLILSLISAMGILIRTVGYWVDYRPPITVWGRLWSMRWIIPRYDHICIPPVLIFLVACYLPRVLAGWHVPSDVALAATTSLVAIMACNLPPSFQRWRLTGFHRIVPGSTNKQEFVKI